MKAFGGLPDVNRLAPLPMRTGTATLLQLHSKHRPQCTACQSVFAFDFLHRESYFGNEQLGLEMGVRCVHYEKLLWPVMHNAWATDQLERFIVIPYTACGTEKKIANASGYVRVTAEMGGQLRPPHLAGVHSVRAKWKTQSSSYCSGIAALAPEHADSN